MHQNISKASRPTQSSCSVSLGVYATLILPWHLAINFTIALFLLLKKIRIEEEVDSLVMIAASTIIFLPLIIVLSVGMFWSVKKISTALVKISYFKPVGFGTIIKLWLSYLSKLHLFWFGFYICLGIIWLIVAQFIPLDDVYHGIADQIGIPTQAAQAGITIIFFIGFLAYMFLFGAMAYILGTLPLALISAIIFRCFTRIKTAA